jgi:hypothetical protein
MTMETVGKQPAARYARMAVVPHWIVALLIIGTSGGRSCVRSADCDSRCRGAEALAAGQGRRVPAHVTGVMRVRAGSALLSRSPHNG